MTAAGASRHLRNQAGFTVGELMVACAIVGLVMTGMLAMLTSGQQSFLMGAGQVEAQQNVRVAFDLMAREIRQAGVDPTNAGFPAVVGVGGAGMPNGAGFRLQSDLNASCTPATLAVCLNDPGERIEYTIVGNTLRRQALGVDAQPQIVIGGLDFTGTAQPAFQYLNRNAPPGVAAAPADIVNVVVMLQTRPTTTTATLATQGNVRVRLTDTITLRNR